MKTQFTLRLDDDDKAHIEQLKQHFRVGTGAAAVLQAVRLHLAVKSELRQRDIDLAAMRRRYGILEQAVRDVTDADMAASQARLRLPKAMEDI